MSSNARAREPRSEWRGGAGHGRGGAGQGHNRRQAQGSGKGSPWRAEEQSNQQPPSPAEPGAALAQDSAPGPYRRMCNAIAFVH